MTLPPTRRELRALERAVETAPLPRPEALTRREALALERAAVGVAPAPAIASVLVASKPEAPLSTAAPVVVPQPEASGSTTRSVRASGTRPLSLTSKPTRPRRTLARSTRFGVLGAMIFVSATVVSTSVPANAYYVDSPTQAAVKLEAAEVAGVTVGGTADERAAQRFTTPQGVAAETVGRDGYSVTEQSSGVTGAGAFTNVPGAAVQWPFPSAVPISSGFGARHVANCSFCSTYHQGLDFIPPAGTPIQIVADGTVIKVGQGDGPLGYNVWVDHLIDGRKVTSVYAHMRAGSLRVAQGQHVTVGQIVGLVGSTGNSTGAHLHFEVHIDGLPVDPLGWLQTHAGH